MRAHSEAGCSGGIAPALRGGASIAGIVLAAGRSTRMGENKLLCPLWGAPLVVHAVDAAIGAGLDPVWVVTGHEPDAVRAVLAGRAVRFAHNPRFADGMASSLRAGVAALDGGVAAAVVLLGDMPRVRARHVRALVDAFGASGRTAICVPEHDGRRGNPVLWPAGAFTELVAIEGDRGGRDLLRARADQIVRVGMTDDAVLLDVDSPELLAALAAEPEHATESNAEVRS